MSVEQEIVAAYPVGAASWDTAAPGVDVTNPWRGDADTARERVLSVVWRRGRLSRVSPVFRGGASTDGS